jgi:hypothetical protein
MTPFQGYKAGGLNRMKYRKLRIAWSVAWGVVAVLLCVLWVRSYWWQDLLIRGTYNIQIGTNIVIVDADYGRIHIWHTRTGILTTLNTSDFITDGEWKHRVQTPNSKKLMWRWSDADIVIRVPTWLPVIVLTMIGAIPWLRFRFSLRTLLIATALVALGLGLVVWASR